MVELGKFFFRSGVVAMPFNENNQSFYLLPDTGMNRGKREWVVTCGLPHLVDVVGDEFTGGGIKKIDGEHGFRSDIRRHTVEAAAKREIHEESLLEVSADQFWFYMPGFFVMQSRKGKLGLFSVSVLLWNLNEEQELWLRNQKKARQLDKEKIINREYETIIRPRDHYILNKFAREYYLAQM